MKFPRLKNILKRIRQALVTRCLYLALRKAENPVLCFQPVPDDLGVVFAEEFVKLQAGQNLLFVLMKMIYCNR